MGRLNTSNDTRLDARLADSEERTEISSTYQQVPLDEVKSRSIEYDMLLRGKIGGKSGLICIRRFGQELTGFM